MKKMKVPSGGASCVHNVATNIMLITFTRIPSSVLKILFVHKRRGKKEKRSVHVMHFLQIVTKCVCTTCFWIEAWNSYWSNRE